MSNLRELLHRTADHVADFREGVGDRPVGPTASLDELRAALGGPLPETGTDAGTVIDRLVTAADPGIVANVGPRYFGFVIGGSLDAATSADLLTTGWDQTAFNLATSPAGAVVEEVAGGWLKEVFGIPAHASFGFVTGAQGANTVGIAAARHRVLGSAGWDVEARGLIGAPRVRVVANEERHATIDRSLRLLGLGARSLEPVATDGNGAIVPDELARVLDEGPDGPTIVCLQTGNVNTGACDDLAASCEIAHRRGAWVHVDGAFGLWAAASASTRHLVEGIELADSWGTDGHKWLNLPYDCGFAFCADAEAHAASMAYTAAYLVGQGTPAVRAPGDYVVESSRRARGFAAWAALRELGRRGVEDLVDRCCALARRFAERLEAADGIAVPNDVVLNQVLVDFGHDERTERVIDAVQRDGTCWMGATTWRGRRLMRISVSNWTTTEQDVDRSAAAIQRIHAELD
ncbi:MAG TPA: pyridoxal-dependent decarboxylase [Actinomycetota bacterium]